MKLPIAGVVGLLVVLAPVLVFEAKANAWAASRETRTVAARGSVWTGWSAGGIYPRTSAVTNSTAGAILRLPLPKAADIADPATDWDDPATWGNLALVAGVAAAGITLFVDWRVRTFKRNTDKRRQQQEWGIRAAQVTFKLGNALNPSSNAPRSPQARTQYTLERLELLSEQLEKADDAFGTLADPGEQAARKKVRAALQDLIAETRLLIKQYNGITNLRSYLVDNPGDEGVSASLDEAMQSTDVKRKEIISSLSSLRTAIGEWLTKSGAMPEGEVSQQVLFRRQKSDTELPAA